MIYHMIAEAKTATADDLVQETGFDLPTVESSLCRLQRYFMIERTGDKVRVMSVGESLIRSQIQYSDDMPFTIENGVIREKKK